MERKTTTYTITSTRVSRTVTFAVAADLHNGPYKDVLDTFRQVDAVLVPGDLLNRHRLGWEQASRFLEEVPRICPVFILWAIMSGGILCCPAGWKWWNAAA